MRQTIGWILALALMAGTASFAAEKSDKPAGLEGEKPVLSGPRTETDRDGRGPGSFTGRRGAGGPGFGGGEVLMKLIKDLDLSDEQRTQVLEISAKFQAELRQRQAKNAEPMQALQQRMQQAKENRDEKAMRQIGQEMRQLSAGAPQFRTIMEQINAVLTEEQRTKFRQIMDQSRRDMGEQLRQRGAERPQGTPRPENRRRGAGEPRPDGSKLEL